MKHHTLILFGVLFVCFTVVYSAFAYFLTSFAHPPSQSFLGFGVYGNNGGLSNYYQVQTAPNVTTGVSIQWRLEISNRMGRSQLVRVVVKLGNLTTTAPSKANPATVADLDNFVSTIADNSNASIQFDWRIQSVSHEGQLTFLNLDLNGKRVASTVGASTGRGFRFIFELWTLDPESGAFQYGYPSVDGRIGEFLTLWFDSAP